MKKLSAAVYALCILCHFACFLPAALSAVRADAAFYPPASREFYVSDNAGILSDDTKKYIADLSGKLDASSGAQVVVVTLSDLVEETLRGGEPSSEITHSGIEEYATGLFREYGIGSRERNDGVMILLDAGGRRSRIEVGYGLEGVLNDAKTGRIQDELMMPHFREGRWDDGIRAGFNAIIGEVARERGVDIPSAASSYRGVSGGSANIAAEAQGDVREGRISDKEFIYCVGAVLAAMLAGGGKVLCGLLYERSGTVSTVIWGVLTAAVAAAAYCLSGALAAVVGAVFSVIFSFRCAWSFLLDILLNRDGKTRRPRVGVGGNHESGRWNPPKGGGGSSGGGGSTRKFL